MVERTQTASRTDRNLGAFPWTMISVAFLLGSVATSVLAGCERATAEEIVIPSGDSPQLGGSSLRNNAPTTEALPESWETGRFDRRTGEWDRTTAENIRWVAALGSQTYGNPVVSGDKVFVGTNNGAGYLSRYPADVDLGCLLCFDRATGEFLWQHSSEKLASGRVHDWPLQGICSTPLVEGDRLWFVTNRCEVRCLDTEGFRDGKDDGMPDPPEIAADPHEADVIWVFDMMGELGVSPRNMAASSVTAYGDLLMVATGNGTGEDGTELPSPEAPSFICLDKRTGELIWEDNSPGENILHGQWSSPAVGVLGGVPQVIFAGGDGFLYAFRADRGDQGKPTLLWKFDCNPKDSVWTLAGDGDRNYIVGTPVINGGLVYIGVGQDPELGEGDHGRLWCIDPTGRGDVSAELAVLMEGDRLVPIPHRNPRAIDPAAGEIAIPNPDSAAVWQYRAADIDGDGEIAFEETMHRTLGTVAIADDLLYVVDLAGIVHCLDTRGAPLGETSSAGALGEDVSADVDSTLAVARQAKVHYTADLLAQSWSSPLIADGRVFFADEDGDITIFRLGEEHADPIAEINMGSSLYTTPVAAGDTIFIATKDKLFAIRDDENSN